jgi:pimeloyl-ACP methyl ester carboxylesterase
MLAIAGRVEEEKVLIDPCSFIRGEASPVPSKASLQLHPKSFHIVEMSFTRRPSAVLPLLLLSVSWAGASTTIPTLARQEDNSTTFTSSDLNLPFAATFSSAITPFTISVNESFLNKTLLKVSLTHIVDDLPGQPEFTDGPPKRIVQGVVDAWTSNYSWRATEADLNAHFNQFTTLVTVPEKFNYSSPIPLHFVHHRSPRIDAIPLLFIHGWPGSFLEVEPLIDSLTNPPNSSLPAFHVVSPSIPGYAFSPNPLQAGMGMRIVGAASNALMQKLGYEKYVVQGGDYGAVIEYLMSSDFPDAVMSLHSWFWVMTPAEADMERYYLGEVTEDEKAFIELTQKFNRDVWTTFGTIAQLRARKLSAALADSPVGLAMWIYDLERQVTWDANTVWTPQTLITWTMMQLIPGVYGTLALAEYTRSVSNAALLLLCPLCPAPTHTHTRTCTLSLPWVSILTSFISYPSCISSIFPRNMNK